ncbi:MAG TPA: CBS domain-containing protein [Rhodothermales bacterium]|nr:CBS domain-containing protein [Rhodothermales bacterium]
MRVRDIMTANPATCTPDSSLQHVAKMMLDCDCGAVPVVESAGSGHSIGIITDRDIVIRTLAQGRDPMNLSVRDAMSESTITISADRDLKDAASTMKQNQIRRLVVTDGDARIVGILAQADIARQSKDRQTGALVEEISEPVGQSTRAMAGRNE